MNTPISMGNNIPASVIDDLIQAFNLQSIHALYDYILEKRAGHIINAMEIQHTNMDYSYIGVKPTICSVLHQKGSMVLTITAEDRYHLLEVTKKSLSENINFSLACDVLIDSGMVARITVGYQPHPESTDDRFIPQIVIYSN